MTKPITMNKHHVGISPADAVYIGRGSKWGNPFVIKDGMDRAEVVTRFRAYINTKPELLEAAKLELKGKNLLCFCAPLACHGDVLIEIANEE